jgi:adenylate kinase
MAYFDFHSLLNSFDFERLVRDVLEIRDAPLTFRSYIPGPDGGIDVKCTNSNEKIIGQVKLYNPKNFNQLKASLTQEVAKVKSINPDRYIIAIGQSLSPKQFEVLMQLFKGYIKSEEDILDKETLNKYLGQKKYETIVKNHTKLLVPNIAILENILSSIVNKDIYTKTIRELKLIKENQRLYYSTTTGNIALQQLQNKRVIIITGNPGVGKTTLARMLVSSLLVLEPCEFYYTASIEEIDQLYDFDKKQVFFIDDFWGQQFDEIPTTRNYLAYFTKLLNEINNSSNHYLILTSRSYIIKSIFKKCEGETLDAFHWNDFRLNLKSYTEEDKARIFLNHLAHFNFNESYFSHLLYDDKLEHIVRHSNYNPRHIEFFIKYVFDYKNENEYSFYKFFEKYLDNPYQFWEKIFEKQSRTAQTILLVLFISSDPITMPQLKSAFTAMQSVVREKLNLQVFPLEFENEIKILEELFLNIESKKYIGDSLISFQNPGIKDYLLEYLRKHMDTWGEALITGAKFFNQLIFVFTDDDELEINDYDSFGSYGVYGKKIRLNTNSKETLKRKILSEFHQLIINTPNEKEFTNGFSMNDSLEDIKYWKLSELVNFFDIDLNENEDILNFIIAEVQCDLDVELKTISTKSMVNFPEIIKIIHKYIDLNPKKLLQDFHSHIKFVSGYIAFHEFKEIYPEVFSVYLEQNIITIRKEIKETILDDIDYYDFNEMGEFDDLLDYKIEWVSGLYGIKLSKGFISNIEDLAQRELYLPNLKELEKEGKKKKATKSENENFKPNLKLKPAKFHKLIKEYITRIDYSVSNPKKIITSISIDENTKKKLLGELSKKGSIVADFFTDIYSISSLHDFVRATDFDFTNTSFAFLDSFVKFYIDTIENKNKTVLYEILESLATDDFVNNFNYFSSETFNKLLKRYGVEKIDIHNFFPLIVEQNNRFIFMNRSVINYLLVNKAKRIENIDEFVSFNEEILGGDPDNGKILLQLLQESTPGKLNILISQEFERFRNSIKCENEAEKVLSVLRYFNFTFNLCWNKKKKQFEEESCSQSESLLELILQFKGMDLSVMDWNIYFISDYFTLESCNQYNIEKKYYKSLYQRIITNQESVKRTHIIYEGVFDFFDIDLYKFACDYENYAILKNLGFEKYILSILNKMERIINCSSS